MIVNLLAEAARNAAGKCCYWQQLLAKTAATYFFSISSVKSVQNRAFFIENLILKCFHPFFSKTM